MNKPNLPKTSHLANAAAKELKELHKGKILECLSKHPEGLIYEEIATLLNMDKHQIGRRVSEIEREMKIFKPGTTKPTSSGRQAYIYKIKSIADFSRGLVQGKLL